MGAARWLAEQLECLGEPAIATTMFEIPSTGAWRVDAYFDAAEGMASLRARLACLDGAPSLAIEPVPDENWVAVSQAALPPVIAGRFVVHGSHDQVAAGWRQGAILIDAGEAFGTAHHATTLGCLTAIDELTRARSFTSVLDLGCGSGVLAIAAAGALPKARILASDIDPVATGVAEANVRRNGCSGRIRVVTAPGGGHPAIRAAAPFDLLIANILAGPLIRMAPSLRRIVQRRGVVVLSGILAEQAAQVRAAYGAAGFIVRQARVRTGWATLVLQRHR